MPIKPVYKGKRFPLLEIQGEIEDIRVDNDRENPYAALILPSGQWVFSWEGSWKKEIEQNKNSYIGLEAEIVVTDHSEEDDEDPWYWLEYVVPQSRELCEKFFNRNKQQVEAQI